MSRNFLDWRNVEAEASLVSAFERRANAHADRLFIKSLSFSLSWGEALSAVRGFGELHRDRLEGRDVAMFMSNGSAFFITYLAVLYSGGHPAVLNAAIPQKAGRKLVEELAPELVFAEQVLDFDDAAVVVDGDMVRRWISLDAGMSSRSTAGDETACYFYSGGTTGTPKRIRYTHDRLLAAGARMQWGWPLHEGEVFLPIAPFSHIYGFLAGICLPIQSGGSSIIPSRFHPAEVLDLIERERVTVLGGGPPAVYQALMSDPDLGRRDLSSLRVCPGGGASFPLEVHRRWKDVTGLTIYEGYGMTEGAPLTVNTVETGIKAGSVGKVVPDTEISIVDMETGSRVLPAGQAGEIKVRGPHTMLGYCNNPEETAMVLRGGWVLTGDVGVMDEQGFLTITDRKKDVIIHKGFNVFPREVEEAIMSHPSVAGACVCGAADERAGEIVLAYVTLRTGQAATPEEISRACASCLVNYKIPARIEILEAFPLTPAGKVDRMALKTLSQRTSAEVAA